MKIAIYYSGAGAGRRLQVLTEHEEDGTVDLGDSDGNLVVGHCPLAETSTAGHAVLTQVPPPANSPGPPAKKKKSRGSRKA